LEVGVGNRLVADYLRNVAGKEVVTLDIDPELHPDVVGDILELPFDDEYFSCSMACEVLEHLPWGKALIALAELRRVSSRCIISVPDNNFEIQLRVCLGPVKRRHVSVRLPKLFRQKELRVTDEHYWELGAQGKGEDDIALALQGAGWQIEREYRNPDFLFHHFYVLRKNVDL
jgi:SAM-dependent methyltransferase